VKTDQQEVVFSFIFIFIYFIFIFCTFQIQDSGNHLLNALCIVTEYKDEKSFSHSARKVVNVSMKLVILCDLFTSATLR